MQFRPPDLPYLLLGVSVLNVALDFWSPVDEDDDGPTPSRFRAGFAYEFGHHFEQEPATSLWLYSDIVQRAQSAGPPAFNIGLEMILEEAVRIAAPAGRIGILGFSATPSAIPQQELTRKELTLYASRLNCGMFPTVIDWISRGLIDPGRIVTHRMDFRDVAEAFELAERNPSESCKILLDFGEAA